MIPSCQTNDDCSNRCCGPVRCRPSGARFCSHRTLGKLQQLPSLFQSRWSPPEASRKTDGSIDPPSSRWQTNGDPTASLYGPSGLGDTVAAMHSRRVWASCTLTYITYCNGVSRTAGAQVKELRRSTDDHAGSFGKASGPASQCCRSAEWAVGT